MLCIIQGISGSVSEGYLAPRGNIANNHFCEAAAIVERISANAGDAIGYRDARKAAAIIERKPSDAGDAIGDGDARKAAAIVERRFADAGHGYALVFRGKNYSSCRTGVIGNGICAGLKFKLYAYIFVMRTITGVFCVVVVLSFVPGISALNAFMPMVGIGDRPVGVYWRVRSFVKFCITS